MNIQSKVKNYDVVSIADLFANKEKVCASVKNRRPFYFVDRTISALYAQQLQSFVGDNFLQVMDAKESNKEYVKLAEYFNALISHGFTRSDVLVTIGGGILQDISGFIASTLYRGIKWIFIPTTLLAQADSCIGSKTSINFGDYKNLIGTFYPPDQIFIDSDFCTTLTPEYFNSGLGEIIKFHLMSDAAGYDRLQAYLAAPDHREKTILQVITESTLQIKKSYFDADEFDTGRRNLLNYGHCFGHALESATDFAVCHGEAVIVGMGYANLFSVKRGIMTPSKYEEFENLLRPFYPKIDWATIEIDDLVKYLKRDKKRAGPDLTMILSQDIGKQFKLDDLQETEVRSVYSDFVKTYPKTK
jgi:3-dehydroquinate synthase